MRRHGATLHPAKPAEVIVNVTLQMPARGRSYLQTLLAAQGGARCPKKRSTKKVDRRDVPNPLGPSRGIFPSGRCEKIDFAEISSEPKCILQAQRFRLIPRRAQVDSERDLGAHRVFESLIHEDIVVHSSASDSVIRRADDMAPAGVCASFTGLSSGCGGGSNSSAGYGPRGAGVPPTTAGTHTFTVISEDSANSSITSSINLTLTRSEQPLALRGKSGAGKSRAGK